jgi:hypothetical protein
LHDLPDLLVTDFHADSRTKLWLVVATKCSTPTPQSSSDELCNFPASRSRSVTSVTNIQPGL